MTTFLPVFYGSTISRMDFQPKIKAFSEKSKKNFPQNTQNIKLKTSRIHKNPRVNHLTKSFPTWPKLKRNSHKRLLKNSTTEQSYDLKIWTFWLIFSPHSLAHKNAFIDHEAPFIICLNVKVDSWFLLFRKSRLTK